MVAIWTPPYFRSDWCMAEWESMMKREAYLAEAGSPMVGGLVMPVVFSDGANFDPRAKETQSRDFSKLNYQHECFKESQKYLDLDDAVRALAEEIEHRIANAPAWDAAFPIADPAAVLLARGVMKLPRM